MSQLKRSPLKRAKFLKKRGPLSIKWEDFRNLKFLKDRDEQGLILCQDVEAGMKPCYILTDKPDLHHLVGRAEDPSLYFEESNLIWVTRNCHQIIHGTNQ